MTTTRLTRAERREQTRAELLDAAERRFVESGFHATTLDQIAGEAGYTKGAVYSNFASKEDLFFAVYERRVDTAVEKSERRLAQSGPRAAIASSTSDSASRQGRDDGWLAVFIEFWAHVLRHPELRERFAKLHERAQEPFVEAVEQLGAEEGRSWGRLAPREVTVAAMAMDIGLALERLVRPRVVDRTLAPRAAELIVGGRDRRESA